MCDCNAFLDYSSGPVCPTDTTWPPDRLPDRTSTSELCSRCKKHSIPLWVFEAFFYCGNCPPPGYQPRDAETPISLLTRVIEACSLVESLAKEVQEAKEDLECSALHIQNLADKIPKLL